MSANRLRQIALTDHQTAAFQTAVAQALDPLLALPLTNALLLSVEADKNGNLYPLTLSGTAKNVPHGLGHEPNGWVVAGLDAPVNIWEDASSNNPDRSKFIRLLASADVTVKILVF